MADQKVYLERYNKTYQLCSELLNHKFRALGKEIDYAPKSLIQSVLATLEVTDLIMQFDYDVSSYKPVVLSAIETTRKELFPDLSKKRFINLDKIENIKIEDESKAELELNNFNEQENNLILRGLPDKSKAYVDKILSGNSTGTQHLQFKNHKNLLKRVSIISVLFPDQKIPHIQSYINKRILTEDQVINIYKCVLSGIEANYPAQFLKTQTKFKAKIMVRFLFENVLQINDPENFLTVNKDLFYEYKLQNVLRLFNYSVKQLIHNAWPEKFKHWQGGRIKNNYWSVQQNRISAIRWLMEKRLGIDIKNCSKISVNKSDFSKHGLSYLFNQYYNSTSKALQEAYPELKPWQLAPMPYEHWNLNTIKEAICWMLDKLQWQISDLPAKYNNREISRKTFSHFGLSGIYENKFNCNIYNLVNCIWPGRFKEWEFGNIPRHFWNSSENRKKFSLWFAEKFNINLIKSQTNFASLEELREYRFYSSLHKYCEGDFNRLQKAYARDLAEQNKSRLLLRKWENLIKKEKENMFQGILMHGFFINLVQSQRKRSIDKFERMKFRFRRLTN